MTHYYAPIEDMSFVVHELGDLEGISRLPGYSEATTDILQAILEQSAPLTSEVVAPTNRIGDRKGTYVENRQVFVPEEFREIYRHYREGGWSGLSEHRQFGGQGLPQIIGVTVEEMWQSANLALKLCPFLSQ